jgi:malate/lactate dehydrogenase
MKVGIIGGAGGVGSAIAFFLATRNLVEEIAVIDVKENLATAHAMDLGQAIADLSPALVSSGDLAALDGCDIVIAAASGAQHNLLSANLKILEPVAAALVRHCPAAVVITASNPIDVLNYRLWEMTRLPARQFVGFSRNDSLRFRIAIAAQLKVPVPQVQATVIGEHGPGMVPLFSSIQVGSRSVQLDAEQRAAVGQYLRDYLTRYEALQAGRTACWTTAVNVTCMVESIVLATGDVQPVSAILHGEYGLSRVSLGVPVILNRQGVSAIKVFPLAPDEAEALAAAAARVRAVLDSCGEARAAN